MVLLYPTEPTTLITHRDHRRGGARTRYCMIDLTYTVTREESHHPTGRDPRTRSSAPAERGSALLDLHWDLIRCSELERLLRTPHGCGDLTHLFGVPRARTTRLVGA
jgi:hypothetical protein